MVDGGERTGQGCMFASRLICGGRLSLDLMLEALKGHRPEEPGLLSVWRLFCLPQALLLAVSFFCVTFISIDCEKMFLNVFFLGRSNVHNKQMQK